MIPAVSSSYKLQTMLTCTAEGGCFIEGEGVLEDVAPDGLNPEVVLVDQNKKKALAGEAHIGQVHGWW